MIVGIGVDLVDIARFERTLERTPRLLERLFSPAEQTRSPRSLAARYAAKEALIKALGGSDGVHWTEIEITPEASGRPWFTLTGSTAAVDRRARASPACTCRCRTTPASRPRTSSRRRMPRRPRSASDEPAARRRAARGDHRRRRDHRERAAPAPAHRLRGDRGRQGRRLRPRRRARRGRRARGRREPARRRRHRRGARPAPRRASSAPILAWLHAPGHLVRRGRVARASSSASRASTSCCRPRRRHPPIAPSACTSSSRPGSARNGIAPEDYRVVFAEAARLERIGKLRVIGLFSHLSNASAEDDRAALRAVPGWRRGRGIRRSRPAAASHRRDARGDRAARGAARLRAHRHRHLRTVAVRRPRHRPTSACAPR